MHWSEVCLNVCVRLLQRDSTGLGNGQSDWHRIQTGKGGREKVKERQENWGSHKRDEGWRETEWWQQRKPSRRQHVNMLTAGLLSGDEEAAG